VQHETPESGQDVPLLAIAAGTLGEWGPLEVVDAAASAGWPAVGVRIDPAGWSDALAARVRRRLEDTAMVALDVEAVFVSPGGDDGELVVDAAAAIGARHVLVVSLGMPEGAFVERFAQLCDRAAPSGIRCVVEFTPILSIPDLSTAMAVVRATERDNAGVLVDNLHLCRSGGHPSDLIGLDPALLPYVQLCDAPADPPEDLYGDALHGRALPGEGGLPVGDFLRFVPPGAAISAEILSASLRERYPDPRERADAVLAAVRRALREAGGR
jgi:sugar phosphate isomerase/epimerase